MANKAVLIKEVGEPDVLKFQEIPDPKAPGPEQVLIRQTAVGVNYIDSYYRSGLYKLNNFPYIPGVEAVGVVEAVGPGVTLALGTRVGYATATSGAYCQRRVIELKKLYPIPNYITDEVAVAVGHKGMTAHMLIFRVYRVNKRDTVLINNVTDGVGQILCQWVKHLGARVIGTVDSQEKMPIAKRLGCNFVANYKEGDSVVKVVREATNGDGVSIVYDSVGKDCLALSLQSLMPIGYYVNYDQSCGSIPGINMLSLAGKGLIVTRANVHLYKTNAIEMSLTANEIFSKIKQGVIIPNIGASYSLAEAARAHADMKSQRVMGSIILKV